MNTQRISLEISSKDTKSKSDVKNGIVSVHYERITNHSFEFKIR